MIGKYLYLLPLILSITEWGINPGESLVLRGIGFYRPADTKHKLRPGIDYTTKVTTDSSIKAIYEKKGPYHFEYNILAADATSAPCKTVNIEFTGEAGYEDIKKEFSFGCESLENMNSSHPTIEFFLHPSPYLQYNHVN